MRNDRKIFDMRYRDSINGYLDGCLCLFLQLAKSSHILLRDWYQAGTPRSNEIDTMSILKEKVEITLFLHHRRCFVQLLTYSLIHV